MHAVQLAQNDSAQREDLSSIVEEFINLDPPVSIDDLIQAVTIVWTSPKALPLIEAIASRNDVKVAHYQTILERRSNSGQNSTKVGELIIADPRCNIQNLMFVFGRVPSLRKRIATRVANHADATTFQLKQVSSCDDLEEGIAELIEQRVQAMDTSKVRDLLHKMGRAR